MVYLKEPVITMAVFKKKKKIRMIFLGYLKYY